MTVGEALRSAAQRLDAVSDTARLDAEVLMAHTLGVSRSDMLLRRMADEEPAGFEDLLARRMTAEPVAYIVGHQEFYGLEFTVTPDVLIPRADSETVIEAAREAFSGRAPPRRICDLGTGSGALLLAAMTVWPGSDGLGVDQSGRALTIAIGNAQRHANTPIAHVGNGPPERPPQRPDRGLARFIQRDWRRQGWRSHLGTFDLVLCNPPYVEQSADLAPSVREFEPADALFSGPEGLDDYRILIPQLRGLLAENGVAVLEIGAGQAEAVGEISVKAGFAVDLRRDLAHRPRALILH